MIQSVRVLMMRSLVIIGLVAVPLHRPGHCAFDVIDNQHDITVTQLILEMLAWRWF
jgi:hypothetical protein